MTEVESKQALASAPFQSPKKNLNDYKLGIENIIYQVAIAKDGEAWCALIGNNLQNGLSGFGKSIQEALHSLANTVGAILEEN